ncbi:acylphosphatase-2-like [Penaeus japonicus]|uniref:acylphosphatase-2-like n=1 Tax=Penaeus japonicus TaxID=27405 RepID=UPI001C716EC4|nr:acylphosphatase-2-like [Penaeus japonicus]
MAAASDLLALDFEVFGTVQEYYFFLFVLFIGIVIIALNTKQYVFFIFFSSSFLPKYTQRKAKELGVRGWCKNTEQGTVVGQLEGTRGQVAAMYDFNAPISVTDELPQEKTSLFSIIDYTHDQGVKLGLRGWCMNTYHGTVVGQLEGPRDKVALMKDWLQRVGSPSSHITKAEFKNEREIQDYTFKGFTIKH